MKIPQYFYFRVKAKHHGTTIEVEDALNEDVVEVVRCSDCKYRYVDGDNVRVNFCALNHNKVQGDDWFCADGERRENEAD